jgi:CBS domain-containing protein
MLAFEVMTASPTTVSGADSIQRAAQLMAQIDVGALPVVEDGKLAGIITDRDIVVRHTAHGESRDCRVSDHMTVRDIQVVHPMTDVNDVIGRMEHYQVRRIPVVDDTGKLVGIIAQADIARHLIRPDVYKLGELIAGISTPHTLQLQMHS